MRAKLEQAIVEGQVAKSKANRGNALRKSRGISDEVQEERETLFHAAQASIKAKKTALELARLDVEFSSIVAPISGQLGRAYVTEGNWVQAGQTLLSSIVATDRFYADFVVDERTFLKYGKQWFDGGTEVKLALAEESTFTYVGALDFVDKKVDAKTGTIQMRAIIDNKNGELRPSFFARVGIPAGKSY